MITKYTELYPKKIAFKLDDDREIYVYSDGILKKKKCEHRIDDIIINKYGSYIVTEKGILYNLCNMKYIGNLVDKEEFITENEAKSILRIRKVPVDRYKRISKDVIRCESPGKIDYYMSLVFNSDHIKHIKPLNNRFAKYAIMSQYGDMLLVVLESDMLVEIDPITMDENSSPEYTAATTCMIRGTSYFIDDLFELCYMYSGKIKDKSGKKYVSGMLIHVYMFPSIFISNYMLLLDSDGKYSVTAISYSDDPVFYEVKLDRKIVDVIYDKEYIDAVKYFIDEKGEINQFKLCGKDIVNNRNFKHSFVDNLMLKIRNKIFFMHEKYNFSKLGNFDVEFRYYLVDDLIDERDIPS